jgi:tetratricopeptide (TPR) repeat protein
MASAFSGIVMAGLLGEFDAGLRACRRAVDIAPDPYSAWYAHWSLVRSASVVTFLTGDAARSVLDDRFRASITVLEVSADASHDSTLRPWSASAMVALAEGHMAMEDWERARTYALRALDGLPPEGDPSEPGWALRALGWSELRLGHLDASRDRFDEAFRRFESIDARFEAAVIVIGLADAAKARQDTVGAATHLGEAYRRFAELGLPAWTARVAQIAGENAVAI